MHIIFKQITTFVVHIISQYLCGFRKGYNTQHVLLRLDKSVDMAKKVGAFMMDLSKAFDRISHDLLIAKLHAYGFNKPNLNFIYCYLKDRKQKVKINAELSSWKDIITGVPQGPLLFNFFINDLFLFVLNSGRYNFAEDNTLSVSDISVEQI